MRNILKCVALGLSVTAGSVSVSTPAHALTPNVWVNLKAAREGHAICMGVSGGDPGGHVSNGTHIIVWDCNYSSDQVWSLAGNIPDFELQDYATDTSGRSMCLNDTGGSNDRGAQVTIAPCNNTTAQQFLVQGDPNGSGCFSFVNVGSKRLVGVANAQVNTVKDGMSVIMWDGNGSADQLWCPQTPPVIHVG